MASWRRFHWLACCCCCRRKATRDDTSTNATKSVFKEEFDISRPESQFDKDDADTGLEPIPETHTNREEEQHQDQQRSDPIEEAEPVLKPVPGEEQLNVSSKSESHVDKPSEAVPGEDLDISKPESYVDDRPSTDTGGVEPATETPTKGKGREQEQPLEPIEEEGKPLKSPFGGDLPTLDPSNHGHNRGDSENAAGLAAILERPSQESEEQDQGESSVPAKEEKPSTFYPKIARFDSGRLSHALTTVPRFNSEKTAFPDSKVHLKGSVKLHGMHADIVFASPTSDTFRIQSRNQLNVVPGRLDNAGFAAWVLGVDKSVWLGLRDQVVQRYRELNPKKKEPEGEVILAGEFCGQGVQRGVAVSKVNKFLAIISMKVDGQWLPDWDYADIDDEEWGVFHIGRAGFYQIVMFCDDVIPAMEGMKAFAEMVEKRCHFAEKVFRVVGTGEGIVWKATEFCHDPRFWFKSKGDDYSVSHTHKLPVEALNRCNPDRVKNYALANVTKARLQQGWAYVQEMDRVDVDTFTEWVIRDCTVEENLDIKRFRIPADELIDEIGEIARPWFEERLKVQGKNQARQSTETMD